MLGAWKKIAWACDPKEWLSILFDIFHDYSTLSNFFICLELSPWEAMMLPYRKSVQRRRHTSRKSLNLFVAGPSHFVNGLDGNKHPKLD
jgi:hypothetical protein